MASYTVTKSFKGSRTGAFTEQFTEGDIVDLDGDLEQIALNEKWVKPASTDDVELSDERLLQLMAAIEQLEDGNEDHWTTTGLPEVAALKVLTGGPVKGAERDAAWKIIQGNS